MGDWNAVLDPNLDRGAISAGTNTLDARHFREFVERLNLVDKFRERHPNKIAWTWAGRGASAQLYSYLDRVLVRQVGLDYLGGPCFDPYKDSDHKFLCVSIRLDKSRCRMSGYRKFNSSLLAEYDFRNQQELMIKRELTGTIIGNWWWGNLKDSIRSFAADYSRRLKLDMVAVLAGDSGQVNIAKAELASLQVKEHQTLVVRARLKRMSCEATNMAPELRAWFASSIKCSSSWKPVLSVAMWYRGWTDRNIMCYKIWVASHKLINFDLSQSGVCEPTLFKEWMN